MSPTIFLFMLVLLLTSGSALSSPQPPSPLETPQILFGSKLDIFGLHPDPWTGTRLIGSSLAQSPNDSWPDASCGPSDAYGALDSVRRCAIQLVQDIPSWKCPSSDRLDGPGVYHCVEMNGKVFTAVVKSWSRTNESQIATW